MAPSQAHHDFGTARGVVAVVTVVGLPCSHSFSLGQLGKIMSPARMLLHAGYGSPSSYGSSSGCSGSPQTDAYLSSLHGRAREQLAMACRVSLEKIVPWAILSLGRSDHALLLALHDRTGLAGLERAAYAFAKCDVDRDGLLCGAEVVAATAVIREDVLQAEGKLPAHVSLADEPIAAAWRQFQAVVDSRLHELALLQLLVPMSRKERGAARPPSAAAIGAAAAERARGGAAARAHAAAAAIGEAITEERRRVLSATDGSGGGLPSVGGLPLLPFTVVFLELVSLLGAGQQGVCRVAEEQRAAAAAAVAATREHARREHAAAAEAAERRRLQVNPS